MASDNGGEAFPSGKPGSSNGMSLRDWFAGQALAGMLCNGFMPNAYLESSPSGSLVCNYEVAAYRIADAMLAERARAAAQ